MESIQTKLGFAGTGQMATALACGFIKSGIVAPGQVLGFDVSPAALDRFQAATGGVKSANLTDLITQSDLILLAVKPQHMADVLTEAAALPAELWREKLLVSIAAGIPIATYQQRLGQNLRCVRVMPNTPCLVGQAASGFARASGATPDDVELVNRLLNTVGLACEVPEKLLDAVTGLSGSGPAYVFMMIEALADGGVKMGLPRATAMQLAAQTLKGSAEMYLATGEHPGALKDRVTSPAGTTIAGVAALEAAGLRTALIQAVEAATNRSSELGRQ
ncbi:MAG: pyrroline-5-carboxylate reductase [Planctomycetia bacterium]|nr:pyrroline-5-carboxylate reductase [Planctomycetia bacterium]